MKIFIISKNKIIITVITIIVIITLILTNKQLVFCNSVTTNEFQNKISNLVNEKEKIAYLTFDDGPNKIVTPKVLDILKKNNVKAIFFVIGKNVEQYPEIVKRAYEEGHYIANHGYDHNNKNLYKNEESFINEIKKTDIAIANAIEVENYCSYVFRFPNGYMSPIYKNEKKKAAEILSKMNYTYIDWNCLNNDSIKKYTSKQLLENLKKSAKNKNTLVILMHDTKDVSNSSEALEDSINYLKSQGYEFANFYSLLQNNGLWQKNLRNPFVCNISVIKI